ncbi:conserved oligomeric Golgi complex subunit 1 isoform X2 [Drosophila subpulchrella]|uniref:conserved oligomeric Golgi complex subunit 1 isoform X2 n=1 Tax=Drosophila subpulchrella TaxID=1486046 RepID=UPI0018A13F03|nr:conserved oligomeric Golgi complex subunit 1 isoform X2 [Drosophila subpulchrella]XP_037723473.1 conserved oligomeric Golgi complex subunit 1 isoform X2 [Drosophila subpulchrella]
MTANLLNLNVDTLFEQHSVSEIDAVHKKIQSVVENKREELRTHVGERYRDLLQAADTIAAMQTSAGTLMEQVRHVQANCRSLNEQQLLGFQSTTNPSPKEAALQQRNAGKKLQTYYGTMAQIKLLTALPELIWTHLDNDRFYAATELFIFSRHISTGLQLDGQSALMQKLPVARKQWEILRPFHVTIKQAVLAALEREELLPEMAVDCLQSLLLLDKSDLSAVLKTFLSLRSSAFLNCLQSRPSEPRRVKDRILASLSVLNSTVELLDKCLLGDSLLFTRLADCASSTCPPSINRMESSERQLAHLLPDIIAGFKPQFEVPQLTPEQIGSALQQWLDKMNALAAAHLQQVFALVSNMQTIQDIKSAARTNGRPDFVRLEQQLHLKHSQLDFYVRKYVPLINARVREIIRSSWAAAMKQTYEQVLLLIEAGQSQAPQQIWREQSDDLPLSLAAALSDQPKRLANRTKGYDGATMELCKRFDSQLADIVQELNVMLQEQTTRAEDKDALIQFLRETAEEQLTEYLTNLKGLQLRERPALLLALRISLALVELCPNLKLCFCQPSSWRQWTDNLAGVGIENWQRICGLIEEEMLSFWLLIVDDVLAGHNCEEKLPKVINHEVVLSDFALWQTLTLEQRDEDQEQSVQSTIRIPSQPRLSLQTYLHQLIQALNEAVPQTLPPKVLQAFIQRLLGKLLSHYDGLAQAECTKSTQNIALQLYFDLKFLERVFGVTREERAIFDQIHAQQNKLRDCIDPFDFELFAEHITAHVTRAAGRLQGELGVLTPSTAALSQGTTAATSLAHEADPNVLCLSSSGSTSLWFPLLPIVMPQATGRVTGIERKSVTQEPAEKDFYRLQP